MIKELRGTESTKKSIQKLKKNEKIIGVNAMNNAAGLSGQHHSTKRAVNILISHRGVQFVDPQTQVIGLRTIKAMILFCVIDENFFKYERFVDISRVQFVNMKSET